jgi:hypothetical protein
MRLSKEAEPQRQYPVQSHCCHYWIIDCSDDSVSAGHCKLCGEQRDFQNRVSIPSDRAEVMVEAAVERQPGLTAW